MKIRTERYLMILLIALSLQSCYQYRLIPTQASKATFLSPPITKCAFFWGLVEPTIAPSDSCLGNGFAKVIVKTNFGYQLVSVITVGMVVPLTFQWECAKDPKASGELGLLIDRKKTYKP